MTHSNESASPLNAFWRTLTKVDHSRINTWIAFRNSLAVARRQMRSSCPLWRVQRDDPQRRALVEIYLNLSRERKPDVAEAFESQLRAPSQLVQDTRNAIGRDHSVEGERFRMLSDQTDR